MAVRHKTNTCSGLTSAFTNVQRIMSRSVQNHIYASSSITTMRSIQTRHHRLFRPNTYSSTQCRTVLGPDPITRLDKMATLVKTASEDVQVRHQHSFRPKACTRQDSVGQCSGPTPTLRPSTNTPLDLTPALVKTVSESVQVRLQHSFRPNACTRQDSVGQCSGLMHASLCSTFPSLHRQPR